MDFFEQYESIQPRYPELKGQVAVITGAGQGIGMGVALRLAREGMRLVLVDINTVTLEAVASRLQARNAVVEPVAGDLREVAAIGHLFDAALDAFGTVNLLINNAGIVRRTPFLGPHMELLDNAIAVNIRAPYLCAQRAAGIMRESGGGCIINMTSVGAVRAHDVGLPYDATKGALDAMTRAMAIELARYQIRVNAVAPGAIYNPSHNPPRPEAIARIPAQRMGTILEVGGVVAFLASPEAAYVTGHIFYMDGGITAQLAPPGQDI